MQHGQSAELGDDDADEAVAALLRVSIDELVQLLGGRWRRAAGSDESGDEWFVTGEPTQVALGSTGPWSSTVVLARPVVRWVGHHPRWTFEDPRTVDLQDLHRDPEALRRIADDIAAGRRSSFRWCRTCRELTAPEHFVRHDGVCMRCAETYHHVVF